MEWVITIGLAIALYVVIYKYEKKMDHLHKLIEEHKQKIDTNQNKIEENYNHIEKLWLNVPSSEKKKKEEEE
jgi:predicted Holliday junction resolvase-like endonuclease